MVTPSSALAGWMTGANPSLPHAAVASGPLGLVPSPNSGQDFFPMQHFSQNLFDYAHSNCVSPLTFDIVTAPFLKHPRTPPTAPGMEYQADSEHLMKRMRAGHSEEV